MFMFTTESLSSPFMDGASACGFFDLILGLFIEADIGGSGKLIGSYQLSLINIFPLIGVRHVVLDEAHKVSRPILPLLNPMTLTIRP